MVVAYNVIGVAPCLPRWLKHSGYPDLLEQLVGVAGVLTDGRVVMSKLFTEEESLLVRLYGRIELERLALSGKDKDNNSNGIG